ncbi:MAG: TetR/AcrR family transcriptional regulator [Sandaracinus sp.]|nr:TetR/AcrR family transcriptional regulator [Sandaracinus sp.]MCB9632602.1 TetR/AcrR family transcriptional regulator [Sandaracinus sp.]
MPRAEKRARLSVDERRAQLLDLALTLFADRTYDEISIDEIAKAAGISKGLLYHYFPSKKAFYVAAVKQASEELLAETDVARELPQSPPNDPLLLRRGYQAFLSFVERRRVAYGFLLRGGVAVDAEVRELVEETKRRLVQRMLEKAGPVAQNAHLRTTLRGIIGFVEAVSLDWLDHGDLERDELADLLARVTMDAVAQALSPKRV